MKFDLIIKEPLSLLVNFEYDVYDPDSETELFSLIEDAMYESQIIDFLFECCNEPLKLTIFGNVSVFLEQLVPLYELTIRKKMNIY